MFFYKTKLSFTKQNVLLQNKTFFLQNKMFFYKTKLFFTKENVLLQNKTFFLKTNFFLK